METKNVLTALSALAHETRLAIFRLLVEIGPEGLPLGGQQLLIDSNTRRLFLLAQSSGLYVSDDLGLHWRHIDAVPAVFATVILSRESFPFLRLAPSTLKARVMYPFAAKRRKMNCRGPRGEALRGYWREESRATNARTISGSGS